MSNLFFTSDEHYGHDNILKFCKRPFSNVMEMREALIANHNSIVKPEDTVYHLGDFAFLPSKDAIEILNRLNGVKHLIIGNHDRKILRDPVFVKQFESVSMKFHGTIRDTMFVLDHSPHLTWEGCHKGSIHLHGHEHGNLSGKYPWKCRIMDVGVDAVPNKYFPIEYEEILSIMKNVPYMSHH